MTCHHDIGSETKQRGIQSSPSRPADAMARMLQLPVLKVCLLVRRDKVVGEQRGPVGDHVGDAWERRDGQHSVLEPSVLDTLEPEGDGREKVDGISAVCKIVS